MRFDLKTTDQNLLLAYYRTSTRLDRAIGLVDGVEEAAPGVFLVQSATKPDRRYITDLASMTCDCPDWTFRGAVNGLPCKHLMAAWLSAHRKPQGGQWE
jgi:hypothetical protein